MICAHTIKKRQEFAWIFRHAQCIQNNLLVLYVHENSHNGIGIGICVARKIGGSVERNRVRRRLREIVRTNIVRMKKDCNIVIVARYPCRNASYGQIQEMFVRICIKAGIMRED
jgi:ribonuclease P protein component